MCVYMRAEREGWKQICMQLATRLKTDASFRKMMLLVFFIAMLLFRTILCRNEWRSLLSNLIGGWNLHNEDGTVNTEGLENIILFIPLTLLLFWTCPNRLLESQKIHEVLLKAVFIGFAVSAGIEFSQLFFKLGTFQLADLFFNTLGGTIGGIIYSIIVLISKFRKR